MKTLSRYLAREVLSMTWLVLIALVLLYALLDLVQQLEDIGEGNYGLLKVFAYIVLSLPGHVYDLLPVAALIGALTALAMLSGGSETTVMRASGMSLLAIGGTLLVAGLVLTLVSFLFGEVVVPFSERFAQRMRLEALNSVVGQQFRSGLWVKDDKRFVNVQEMLPDTSLKNVKIYEFDADYRLTRLQSAKRGEYQGDNAWTLTDVQDTLFNGSNIKVQSAPSAQWKSVLTPEILGVLLVKPEQMSVWNLFTYIKHLRENKQKTTRYEIARWSKLIYPLSTVVMMFLAVPFTIYQRRAGTVGGRIFLGVILGVAFHLLTRLASNLAQIKDWDPMLASLTPTALFLGIALVMNWAVERR